MSKYSVKDAEDIQNSCFKLNSLQLRALLTGYLYANNEPHIPPVSPALMPSRLELRASAGHRREALQSLGMMMMRSHGCLHITILPKTGGKKSLEN